MAIQISGRLTVASGDQLSFEGCRVEAVFDEIVHRVTWIIYGEFNATETDERMVRLALERYKIDELLRTLPRP